MYDHYVISQKLPQITLKYLSDKNPAHNWIYRVSSPGNFLPGCVHVLHSHARAKGQEIRPPLHNGQCVLHIGVWIPVRFLLHVEANVQQREDVGVNQLPGMSPGHPLLFCDLPKHALHCTLCGRPNYSPLLAGAGLRSWWRLWIEILWANVQILSFQHTPCIEVDTLII